MTTAPGGSDEWITSSQLSEEWKISVRTLDYWAYEGRGPAFAKIGRQRRYRRSDLEAWISQNTVESGAR